LIRIIISIFFLFSQVLLIHAVDWKELKSEHFMVYFTADKSFASKVLYRAEKDYRRIANDLGYARYSNFWTWSNRVRIYIYPDHNTYLEVTSQPEWSEGMADYRKKRIHSYAGSAGFLTSILPHEMAHLIFRDFVGFKGEIPLWLDEGVAQWEEETEKGKIQRAARDFLKRKVFLSLNDLMDLDVRLIDDTDKIHLRSTLISGEVNLIALDAKSLIDLYYLESASLIGFLIDRYGTDSFTDFCRQLRDGANLEDALSAAYPTHIHNLDDLSNRWIEYLKEE
jgi:hypothetical protein